MSNDEWLLDVSRRSIRHAEYWRVQGAHYRLEALEWRDTHIRRREQARDYAKQAEAVKP
jgi:hypothetical protein